MKKSFLVFVSFFLWASGMAEEKQFNEGLQTQIIEDFKEEQSLSYLLELLEEEHVFEKFFQDSFASSELPPDVLNFYKKVHDIWVNDHHPLRFSLKGVFILLVDRENGVLYKQLSQDSILAKMLESRQLTIMPWWIDQNDQIEKSLPLPVMIILQFERPKGVYEGTSLAHTITGGCLFGEILNLLIREGQLAKLVLSLGIESVSSVSSEACTQFP